MSDFNVLILGSGAATPTFTRHCSGQLVTIGSRKMLIDCGENTQNQLRKYHQKLRSIKWVFLSHLHGDHFFGLPGLLSTMHLCGRSEPLTLFAPKGVKASLELLFEVSGTHVDYPLDYVELDNDSIATILDTPWFTVKAFPLIHSLPTFGFLFEEAEPLLNLCPGVRDKYQMTNDWCVRVKQGEDLVLDNGQTVPNAMLTQRRRCARRYAYCCDTAFSEEIAPKVKEVDLLCMESTFDNTFAEVARQRQHSTAGQAATIAAMAGAKRLLLTHFSARYKNIAPLLEEARAIFPATDSAEDGKVIEL